MGTKYKITIEKTETVTKLVRGRWELGASEDGNGYGYAPDREEEVTEREVIYEQTVGELKVIDVITAVNAANVVFNPDYKG